MKIKNLSAGFGAALVLVFSGWAVGDTTTPRDTSAPWTVTSTTQQECGVMLGGIGTGFLELWPDGGIHDWSIFNRGHWGYRQDFWPKNKADRLPVLEMNQDSLQFYVRACPEGGKPVARRLSTNGEQTNVYSANNWMQNVESISYDPTFPGATLAYKDSTLPVQVTGQFFSPIIPHDLRTSATPGTYMVFTIKNTSDKTQTVSLASYLRNPLGRGDGAYKDAASRALETRVTTDGDTTYLTMDTKAAIPNKTTLGTICLSTSGGEPSWIAMDFGEFLLGRTLDIKPWNQRYETPLRNFRKSGKLPNTGSQPCPTALGPLTVSGGTPPNMQQMPDLAANGKPLQISADVAKLTDDQVVGIIEQAKKLPSLSSMVEQAQAVDPTLLDPKKNGRYLVDIIRQAVSQYSGAEGKSPTWGDAMLCSTFTLKPGESHDVRMILSWNFPNHPSPDMSRNMGHMYSSWFKSAEEVNRFLAKNYADFSAKVHAFRSIFAESTLPQSLLTSVSVQMNTLICSTWWTGDDKMGVWEGLGTCGLNTMDVSYQGSHPIPALFPDFEKNWTTLATTYQNETTGRLYHSLPSDLSAGGRNNGYGYVDVNCHLVLIITRDYLQFGDKPYLEKMYPHIVKELGVFEALDTDNDGLPDVHTESNTYDTWELRGTPSYLSSIWIGALRAGVRLATDMGDTANAAKWQGMLDKAVKTMNEKLWNGEYYNLWFHGDQKDEACMADQLSGEMYTHLIGLGNSMPPDRAKAALAAIYKYNYDPDQGLFNGIYPPGKQPNMPTYRNVQGEGNWTGIEYALAAAMIDQGMVDEGMSIIDSVQRRYLRASREFNHEECGPHYYRPMSIWAALMAATGFKADAPKGILTIASPLKIKDLKAPWVSATGWGEYERTESSFTLDCRNGDTGFQELRVNVPGLTKAQLGGSAVSAQVSTQDGLTVFKFSSPVKVKTGEKLVLN